MHQTVQEIRRKLRLFMDGVNSSSMREKGVSYKMNFGVPVMTLKTVAGNYPQDSELAEMLWKEDTRELKILATLIQPSGDFYNADNWVRSVNNLELAEQLCLNLLCKVPGMGEYAERWIQSDEIYIRITGFLLYSRLFIQGFEPGPDRTIYLETACMALSPDFLLLTNAVLISLKKLGRQSPENASFILSGLKKHFPVFTPFQQAVYDELIFEFEFYNS